MKFSKNIYASPDLIHKKSRTKWALKYGMGNVDVYILALPNNNNQLEIVHARELKQTYYKLFPPFVVGFAKNYEEAVSLVCAILSDCYDKTGSYDIKQFIVNTNNL